MRQDISLWSRYYQFFVARGCYILSVSCTSGAVQDSGSNFWVCGRRSTPDQSNVTYRTVLSCSTVYHEEQGEFNVRVCLDEFLKCGHLNESC